MPIPQFLRSRNFVAVLFMVAGILVMSVTDAIAKLLVESDYSVVQMLAIRGAVLMAAIALWTVWQGGPRLLRTERLRLHLLRSVFGVLAPLLFYLALKGLPLATATVIFFISPFVMTALSVPLFGEKVGIHRWCAIVLGFIGVLVVMQPGGGMLKIEALLVLGSSFSYCAVMLTGRVLSRTETTLSVVFYNTLGVLVITGLWSLFDWQPMPLRDIALIALMAMLSLASTVCMLKAFAIGEIGMISPFQYTGIIWSVVFGYLFFGDFPSLNVWIGIAIIVGSGLYMIHRENLKRL